MASRKDSIKALTVGFALIFTFAFVELIGGFITNSLALLSDAGHMLTDSVSLLIALIAQILIQKSGNNNKMTYGLYRLEVLAALINGVFLLGLVGYIAYEAVNRFITPEKVMGPQMLAIASMGLAINIFVGYMLYKKSSENINVRAAFLHVVTDTLGSISAIIAGIAITVWNLHIADPILSIAISLLILPSTYSVIKESLNVLLELAPSSIDAEHIQKKIKEIPGVVNVHDLHIWSITPGNPVLTAHVVVSNIEGCNEVLDKVREIACECGIDHTTIQIEREGFLCPPTCPFIVKGAEHSHKH